MWYETNRPYLDQFLHQLFSYSRQATGGNDLLLYERYFCHENVIIEILSSVV